MAGVGAGAVGVAADENKYFSSKTLQKGKSKYVTTILLVTSNFSWFPLQLL